jgi:hypothetical protein
MQDPPTYYKDGVTRILDLLKDTFGTTGMFKAYFNGQPEGIPESLIPCIMVSGATGEVVSAATGTDQITEVVSIIVALNKKDDYGASPDVDLTEFKLRKLVFGQDPATQEYLPQTIMYAIRKHISMDDAVLNSRVQISFDESDGAGVNVRGPSTVTQEAIVRVTLTRLALVPSRD